MVCAQFEIIIPRSNVLETEAEESHRSILPWSQVSTVLHKPSNSFRRYLGVCASSLLLLKIDHGIYNLWEMNQSAKEIKKLAYFKTEIEEKISEMVGMVGIDLYLPPWFSVTNHPQAQQENYFDTEVQYFIVDTFKPLTERTQREIVDQANKLLKTNLSISKKYHQNRTKQQSPVLVHLQLDEKQATIAVFCFQIQTNQLVRVKSWTNQYNLRFQLILQQLLGVAACCEFTGLKFKQLAFGQQQLTISIEVGKHLLTLVSPLDRIMANSKGLVDAVKQSILLWGLKLQTQGHLQPIEIEFEENKFAGTYLNESWPTKVKFVHFCCQQLRVTMNQMRLVAFKPELYLRNICHLVREYVEKSYCDLQPIQQYINLIIEQPQHANILLYFDHICLEIYQTQQLPNVKKHIK